MPMKLRHVLVIILSLIVSSTTVLAIELANMLTEDGKIWAMKSMDFMTANARNGFRWVSNEKDAARAYKVRQSFLGHNAVESIVKFKGNTIYQLNIIIYNRGDLGPIPQNRFEASLARITASLSKWAGSDGKEVNLGRISSDIHELRKVWTKRPNQVALEYSYSTGDRAQGQDFLGEYIRVLCMRYDKNTDLSSALASSSTEKKNSLSPADRRRNVKREADGDIYIDGVPMVDQGHKGYCAVATAERILRYYGRSIDQHELAQMANTYIGGGTSPSAMFEALHDIGSKLRCRSTVLESFNLKNFQRLVARYNKAAKKNKQPKITLGRAINVTAVYSRMDPETLKKTRLEMKGDYKNFERYLDKYITRGIPICWSVMLGIIPEKPSIRGGGGHMRLIIGYNKKSKQILCSDSWGPGHELKRMNMEDAWAITTGVYVIEPQ